jgi:rare lipoprotein A
LSDRYTGRHIRHARHATWLKKKRALTRPGRQLLPAAAALTVAGLLVGGTGAAMQLGSPASVSAPGPDRASALSPADRSALADRASRGDARDPATVKPSPSTSSTQPSGNGRVVATGACKASYYDEPQGTASGETFNPDAFTAANKTLPFNSRVRVTNVANGKSVVVRINDRGPYISGRCLDLSRAAFRKIASLGAGVVDVRYEVLAQDAT